MENAEKSRLNSEQIWKIQKKIVKWYGNMDEMWNDVENMEERQVEKWKDMENMEKKWVE